MSSARNSSETAPGGLAETEATSPRRIITVRSVLLALLLAFLAAFISDYHDGVAIGGQWQVSATMHNHVAPLVLGLLFFFLMVLNALLHKIHRRLALGAGELALALALALMAAPIPRYFAQEQVSIVGRTPAMLDSQDPRLRYVHQDVNVYGVLRDREAEAATGRTVYRGLLPLEQSKQFHEKVLPDAGTGEPGKSGQLRWPWRLDIPWGAWIDPLLHWAPLVLAFMAFSVSFGYLVYRQWAHRELVRFPLAELAAEVVRKREDRAWPDVFYKGSFWGGLALTAVIFSMAGMAAYLPKMIKIPTGASFYALAKNFPFLDDSFEGYSLLRPVLFFTIVSVAFLLPSEISLTAWFMWPVMVCCTYFYFTKTGTRWNKQDNSMLLSGAWWAMALLILYAGRWYYWGVLKTALGFRVEGIDTQSTWIARAFLTSLVLLTALLAMYGLPIDIAVVWVAILSVWFLVLCRLVAEMGIPWTPLTEAAPLTLLVKVLGAAGLGARVYSLLVVFQTMLIPQKGSVVLLLAPGVANAAHVEHRITGRQQSLKIVGPFLLVVLLLCAGVTIYLGYSTEGPQNDLHATSVPNLEAKNISNMLGRLDSAEVDARIGGLDASGRPAKALLHLPGHWGDLKSDEGFWTRFAVGFALVMATGLLRLKLPRFPFHPLPLVVVGTWMMSRYWWSFLLGWALKTVILRIGGSRLFERCRPFFAGVVVGQAATLLGWVVVNIYSFLNNDYVFEREWWQFLKDIFSA